MLMTAVATPALAAPVDHGTMGQDIGVETTHVTCPPHSVLVGLREVLGYWLYQVSPACAALDSSGNQTTDEQFLPSLVLENIGGLGVHNILDFMVAFGYCPPNTSIAGFSGIVVNVVDKNASDLGTFSLPGSMALMCQGPTSPGYQHASGVGDWQRSTEDIPWASFQQPGGFAFSQASSCAPGEVAIGVWGWRDSWLRSIGLTCQARDEVRPRSPAEVAQARASILLLAAQRPMMTPHYFRAHIDTVAGNLAAPGQARIPAQRVIENGDAKSIELCKRQPQLCH